MTLRVDLQTHTCHSNSCGWMTPETLVNSAESANLDAIAVTDHNTMEGVQEAERTASDDLLVIPGEEVDTTKGQIIGLFLSESIDPGMTPSDVLNAIHDQGGVAFAPHPFDEMRAGLERIDEYVAELDAIESVNSRCLRNAYNRRAKEFAQRNDVPCIGGSDAHFSLEVGTAYTLFDINEGSPALSIDMLKKQIKAGNVAPAGSIGYRTVHAGTKIVKLYNNYIKK
ncbi:MAG: CehA/McbA family metallohydrolase [Halobacteriaceae archaeon]